MRGVGEAGGSANPLQNPGSAHAQGGLFWNAKSEERGMSENGKNR